MSSIGAVSNTQIPTASSKPPPAPPPARPAADADGDNDGTTSVSSKGNNAVDVKT